MLYAGLVLLQQLADLELRLLSLIQTLQVETGDWRVVDSLPEMKLLEINHNCFATKVLRGAVSLSISGCRLSSTASPDRYKFVVRLEF